MFSTTLTPTRVAATLVFHMYTIFAWTGARAGRTGMSTTSLTRSASWSRDRISMWGHAPVLVAAAPDNGGMRWLVLGNFVATQVRWQGPNWSWQWWKQVNCMGKKEIDIAIPYNNHALRETRTTPIPVSLLESAYFSPVKLLLLWSDNIIIVVIQYFFRLGIINAVRGRERFAFVWARLRNHCTVSASPCMSPNLFLYSASVLLKQ